jgi:hypothetical protein
LILIGQALHGLVVEDCIREVGDIGEGCAWFETAELLIEDELQQFGDLQRSR